MKTKIVRGVGGFMSFFCRIFSILLPLFFSASAFAEDAAASGSTAGYKYIGAGLAIGIAVIGGGLGQGRAAAGAFEGIGRNPQSYDKLFTPLLISLALIEFQALLAFVIGILCLVL